MAVQQARQNKGAQPSLVLALALASLPLATALQAQAVSANVAQTPIASSVAPDAATCFDGQPELADARAAKSTVLIVVRDSKGHLAFAGSGFIVQDSKTSENPHNKIMTSAHVVDDIPAGGWIEVTASDSDKIGRTEKPVFPAHYGADALYADLAVLSISNDGFFPGQKAKYDGIAGIPLGPQSRVSLVGIVANPTGLTEGNSGGPALDEQGRAIGVVKGAVTTVGSSSVVFQAPVFQHPFKPGTHQLLTHEVGLEQPDRGHVIPINDRTVLSALGNAGRNAQLVDALKPTPVRIFGAPEGDCEILSTILKPMDFSSLDDFMPISPGPISLNNQFDLWFDPEIAAGRLKSVLQQAHKEVPSNEKLTAFRNRIESFDDIRKMPLKDVFAQLTDLIPLVKDDDISERLLDAAVNVRAYDFRNKFTPPKLPDASIISPRPKIQP